MPFIEIVPSRPSVSRSISPPGLPVAVFSWRRHFRFRRLDVTAPTRSSVAGGRALCTFCGVQGSLFKQRMHRMHRMHLMGARTLVWPIPRQRGDLSLSNHDSLQLQRWLICTQHDSIGKHRRGSFETLILWLTIPANFLHRRCTPSAHKPYTCIMNRPSFASVRPPLRASHLVKSSSQMTARVSVPCARERILTTP